MYSVTENNTATLLFIKKSDVIHQDNIPKHLLFLFLFIVKILYRILANE